MYDRNSLEKFRWYFFFSSCLCVKHIEVHKCSAALFTAETKETLKAPPAGSCSIFVWIKMQWLPIILHGKRTDKALFCLYEEIYFICVTYLFDLELVLKWKFSIVIYISIIFTFCHLADDFIQSNLQMRRIEVIKTNKRARIGKCYINILYI